MASKTFFSLLLTLIHLSIRSFCVIASIGSHVHGSAFVKSAYWSSDSGLPLSSIDSTLFTHMYCAFADLNSSTFQLTVPPSKLPSFSSFTHVLRRKNPSIKTLVSIGGGNTNTTSFATMASYHKFRKIFINSSINLARGLGFHGLDLDWEYPQVAKEMHNLGKLLKEWRKAVEAESRSSGKEPLILTLAGYYSSDIIYYKYDPPRSVKYPIPAMANSLDWVNVMAYDFYQPTWRNFTEAHAALYDPSGRNFSGSYGIHEWIKAGFPSHKLVLGFPYYGYAWRLVNPSDHGLLAPAKGPVGVDGTMFYYQIREFIRKGNNGSRGVRRVYNASVGENYSYQGTTWIGYDDVEAIYAKVSYSKQKGLLGYVAWHVGGDDASYTLSKTAATTAALARQH